MAPILKDESGRDGNPWEIPLLYYYLFFLDSPAKRIEKEGRRIFIYICIIVIVVFIVQRQLVGRWAQSEVVESLGLTEVITHAPGHMFVCDVRNHELKDWPVPGEWSARPGEWSNLSRTWTKRQKRGLVAAWWSLYSRFNVATWCQCLTLSHGGETGATWSWHLLPSALASSTRSPKKCAKTRHFTQTFHTSYSTSLMVKNALYSPSGPLKNRFSRIANPKAMHIHSEWGSTSTCASPQLSLVPPPP